MPFCCAESMVSSPPSRRRTTRHRSVVFKLVQIPELNRKTKPHPFGWGFVFLAEQEGFEPSVPFWGTHDFQSCPL